MQNKKGLQILLASFIVIAAVLTYGSIVSGINISKIYFYGLLAAVVFAFAAVNTRRKIYRLNTLETIRKSWGKPRPRKRDFDLIASLFKKTSSGDAEKYQIDDQTWDDLDMDDIYSLMDRTFTNPGEQMLYRILRRPLFICDKLEKRNEIISSFEKNNELREDAEISLFNLGRDKHNYMISLLYDENRTNTKTKFLLYIMPVLFAASIVSIFFIGVKAFVFLVMPIYAYNLFLHNKLKNQIGDQMSSIKYLNRVIGVSMKLGKNKNLGYLSEILKTTSSACSRLFKITGRAFMFDVLGDLGEYANIVMLKEEKSYFNAIEEINKHIDGLRKMYMALGEVDALLSVASYRSQVKYVNPEFVKDGTLFDALDIVHPLLEKPVGNDIYVEDRGIMITGSNMSGKSTFLRTIGINAVLAQTIYTCLAAKYRANFFRVMSSISQSDNLKSGKSYYMAEAESLLRVVKSCDNDVPVLCMVDEIFRGTNPVERINASAEILSYLEQNNCLTVVATHDLELTELTRDYYDCYCFGEDIGKSGFEFDYKIKKGVSTNRNAVKLMKYLGYPEEILNNTQNRINVIDKK